MKDFIYIKLYKPPQVTNKLLVIGFLRKIFGFKFFFYINY